MQGLVLSPRAVYPRYATNTHTMGLGSREAMAMKIQGGHSPSFVADTLDSHYWF